MKWFRLYHDVYRNPKVQDMKPELFRFWVNFLCVANESTPRGTVASEAHLRRALGLSKPVVRRYLGELEARRLLRRGEQGALRPHDWDAHQRDSDDAAKRKRHQRAGTCDDTPNADVTGHVAGHVAGQKCDIRALDTDTEGDTEGEENPPLPPSRTLGQEYRRVGEWAIQLGSDVSWGTWVDHQGMCGHSAADIKACLEECAGSGKLTRAYAAAKLRGWASEGGRPKPRGEKNGRTAVQQPAEETRQVLERPDLPRTPEFAEIHAMWDRVEARARGEAS